MSVANIVSRKTAMFLAQLLVLVGMNGSGIHAEDTFDCSFESQISDIAGQIGTDRLTALESRIGNLNRRYDVDAFFCLSESTITAALDDHVTDIAENFFASPPEGGERILVYLNTAERQMTFRVDGPAWNVWRDAVMPSLRQHMRGSLAADNWAEAIDRAILGLETDILRPMRSTSPEDDPPISRFSLNVTQYVLAHEMAHALIRELDIPVLANEEAMADSFATIWIASTKGENGPAIIMDRVKSWLMEDSEVSREDYDFRGEHLLDIRRAYQAACLLFGANPAGHLEHVEWLEFSQDDLDDCSDTAPDQARGWGRVLEQYLLADNEVSDKVTLVEADDVERSALDGLSGVLASAHSDLRRFDWPNPITLQIENCPGTAFWRRTSRTITLCVSYVHRFYRQGKGLEGDGTARFGNGKE